MPHNGATCELSIHMEYVIIWKKENTPSQLAKRKKQLASNVKGFCCRRITIASNIFF